MGEPLTISVQPWEADLETLNFDYVIVGAGAAGSVLAAGLSENGKYTVCLLEAGPEDRHRFIHIPAGFTKILPNPGYVWHFGTVPTEKTAGRSVALPQGKTLGGSTSVNGMIFVRGLARDFDGWAQMGNTGWSYEDVLPFFRQIERRQGGDTAFRGTDGPLPVTDVGYREPLSAAFIEGAKGLGLPFNPDYNGRDQFGTGYYQTIIERGKRVSAASAWLKPARGRRNLDIRTNCLVSRVIIEGGKALGVDTLHAKTRQPGPRILARREVIISAGAINTPKLLNLSGIGDAEALRHLGIPATHHLPGVGANLQDHYYSTTTARARGAGTFNEKSRGLRLALEVLRWSFGRPSLLGLPPSLVQIFAKSREGLDQPDLQGIFFPASYGAAGLADEPGMTCGMWQHRPHSRGYVRTVSADPAASPEIQPNYLQDEFDRRTIVAGLNLARRLLSSDPIRRYVDAELAPGPNCRSDDELLDYCYRTGSTTFHPIGTARMGLSTDPASVVDSRLRVHGVNNLRVIDASVMPTLVSGNTMATTLMLAAKGSADILSG